MYFVIVSGASLLSPHYVEKADPVSQNVNCYILLHVLDIIDTVIIIIIIILSRVFGDIYCVIIIIIIVIINAAVIIVISLSRVVTAVEFTIVIRERRINYVIRKISPSLSLSICIYFTHI